MEKQQSTEEGGVSKIISSWYNGSQQLLISAKMKFLGEGYWVPSDNKEIVVIPHHAQKTLIRLRENDIFSICRTDYTAGPLYHVLMKWKNADRLSIIRTKAMLEIIHDFNGFVVFKDVYRLMEHLKDVKTLTALVYQHPAWRPVHIASKMGLLPFFKNAKENDTLKKLLNLTCQPEQKYPLHICIENNHIELVKYLLENGEFHMSTADVKGQNALHYAADSSGLMVQMLCEKEEVKNCINRLNNDGYTPLFLSVINCRPSCIAAFTKQDAILNVLCQGRSPLQEAMLQNNSKVKDVIKTLMEASPDVVKDPDPLTGNSALHWATNKQSLSAFLDLCVSKIDVNVVNKAGRAALHCHTFRGDLGCVVCLAGYNANLNVQDAEGNTCLHIAVYNEYLDIVKALLVLGADSNILNHDGLSCRHLAGRSKTTLKTELIHCLMVYECSPCQPDIVGCSSWCSAKKEEDFKKEVDLEGVKDIPPDSPKKIIAVKESINQCYKISDFDQFMQEKAVDLAMENSKDGKKLKVLMSLDGGGIRGLILVMILKSIEKELGGSLSDYIDWVAGTSTGSFLAAMLATGKSVKSCLHLYLKFKDQLFEGWTRPYNSEKLEKYLKSELGENVTMADVSQFKLMVVTTVADVHPIRLHIFRSYLLPLTLEENKKLDYDDPKEMPLWKALRCSSAAPTYFSVVDKKYVDGGLVANNPTTELLTEIHRFNALNAMNKNDAEIINVGCVLSIGTGRIPDSHVDSLNVSTSSPVESMTALRNLSILLVDQVTATEGLPVERARAWCHDMEVPFFRFSTPLSKEYVLDTKDDKEVVQMMWETAEYMITMKPEIDSLVDLLKALKKPSSTGRRRAPLPPASP